jgi:hypothetical protein
VFFVLRIGRFSNLNYVRGVVQNPRLFFWLIFEKISQLCMKIFYEFENSLHRSLQKSESRFMRISPIVCVMKPVLPAGRVGLAPIQPTIGVGPKVVIVVADVDGCPAQGALQSQEGGYCQSD